MKKIRILLLLVMVSVITAQWKDLTLEDVFKKSPFKIASIGQWKWSPDTDEYLFFKMDTTIKALSIYKFHLVTVYTILFIQVKYLVHKTNHRFLVLNSLLDLYD